MQQTFGGLLLAACQPEKPAATATVPTTTPAAETDSATAASPAADTLHVADSLGHPFGLAWLRPSIKAAFDQLRATDPLPLRPAEREETAAAGGKPAPTNFDSPASRCPPGAAPGRNTGFPAGAGACGYLAPGRVLARRTGGQRHWVRLLR